MSGHPFQVGDVVALMPFPEFPRSDGYDPQLPMLGKCYKITAISYANDPSYPGQWPVIYLEGADAGKGWAWSARWFIRVCE